MQSEWEPQLILGAAFSVVPLEAWGLGLGALQPIPTEGI